MLTDPKPSDGSPLWPAAVSPAGMTSASLNWCAWPLIEHTGRPVNDQIIDRAMARSLHTDACRDHPLVGWIVMWDPPAYPDKFTARLVTNSQSPYVLIADSLAGIREQLPPLLEHSDRQPGALPEVMEIWFSR